MDDRQFKSFCGHLKNLRTSRGLSLRAVEKITANKISNAYLSQLENGQIRNPSANILFSLSEAYKIAYESLMEKAGYISSNERTDNCKHGKAATFAVENLTSDEEQELLEYLQFIRKKKGK